MTNLHLSMTGAQTSLYDRVSSCLRLMSCHLVLWMCRMSSFNPRGSSRDASHPWLSSTLSARPSNTHTLEGQTFLFLSKNM